VTAALAQNGVTPTVPLGIDQIPGAQTRLNVTTATVLKDGPGRLVRLSVVVAGSAPGAAYDSASTSGNDTTNQVAVIPNVIGAYEIDWPCLTGVVVEPGSGQTVAAAFY
jgi:hypothetical protein